MKWLAIVAAFLPCCPQPALGSIDPALQQSLISAMQRAELSHDQSMPYELDVDFVAQLNVPTRGHLTLKWGTKDHWRREVTLGPFEQVEVKNGEWHYTWRNADFTPVRVGELINLLSFGAGAENLVAKKEKRRVENGVEMECVETIRADYKKESPHEFCLSGVSNDILVNEWQDVPDEKKREQFDNFVDFGAHRYPRKLELLVNGSKAVTADVVNLFSAPFDESLLRPPQGAISRRECEGLQHAVPKSAPEVSYPRSASDSGLMGDTTVAMTVLTDGSVADIHLVGRSTRSMDDATLQTLKRWKFKPAMCGSEPVVTDITVVVSFRIN